LVTGLAVTLAGDVLFALSVVEEAIADRLINALLLVGVVYIGAAALHPSMPALTEEAGDPAEHSDTLRVIGLALGLLVAPLVLLVQDLRNEPLDLAAVVTVMILLALLVAGRVMFVTGGAERAARRQAALSRYTAELLVAASRDQLVDAAQRAADAVVRHGSAYLIIGEPIDLDHGRHAFAAPVEVRGEQVGMLVADASPTRLRRVRDVLNTIAVQLSIALERDRLLATEREAAAVLAEQNARLVELDRMKDSFVSSVSHELRTPLTSMMGYLEILREGEAGELTGQQARYLEIVDRNCKRLNDLIGDILGMARFDSGKMVLNRTSFDLCELVARHVESISATARGRGVDVINDADPGRILVDADEMRIGQLLDNLLSNAVKFTPTGGTVRVRVTLDQGGLARLEVSDSGVGIPSDELDRLFDRFFRASTAGTIGGTGLGLAIAKKITEAHGGTIEVRSELGVGTTFVVDLPVDVERSATTEEPLEMEATA
jgi:signal transduction histidine kinase